MVSLPLSFLSLAWASTVADDVGPEVDDLNVKNKLILSNLRTKKESHRSSSNTKEKSYIWLVERKGKKVRRGRE